MTDSIPGLRSVDAVTGSDLQTVTFATAKGFGRGYDHTEVDAFVERCANVVDRLRQVMAEQQAQITALQERIERDSRSNEVAQAMSVLITAQQTADRTVAQADGYSAKVMAEARELYEDTRRNAATLEQETEDKARHVYESALSRAEAIEREANDRAERMNLNSESVQQELDQQTAYLRTLRDTTRTQIQAFLEGLLDHVTEEYGRAHPLAAEAASGAEARETRRSNRAAGRSALSRGSSGRAGKSGNRASLRVAGQARGPVAAPAAQAPADQAGTWYADGTYYSDLDEGYRDR